MVNAVTCNLDTGRPNGGDVPRRGWRRAAGAAVMAAMLSGCSSFSSLTGGDSPPAPTATASIPPTTSAAAPQSSNGSFTTRVKSFFSGGSSELYAAATPVAAPGAPAAPYVNCPSVDYRQGAATLPVNAPGAENAALSLRYQASFVQTARECVVRGGDLIIKVGVQGRIVVGPAGASGQVNIPLRYALVREGLEPRTMWTKLFMVPVTIPDGQLNLPWIHVEEEMTVPLPPGDEIDGYVIYIGFDPDGATPPPKAKPVAKPKPPARPR